MEPVCAEVFPGNSVDASSYPAFIRDNDIRKGIIVADKGTLHVRTVKAFIVLIAVKDKFQEPAVIVTQIICRASIVRQIGKLLFKSNRQIKINLNP